MIDFLGDFKEIEQWIEEHVAPAAHKADIVATTKCANCGTQVNSNTAICANCGMQQASACTTPTPVVLKPTIVLKPNHWPTQHEVWSTFHNNGSVAWVKENLVDVPCPWTLHMDKIVLHQIQIHKMAAESLTRILNYIWEQAGSTQEAIEKLHYDRYSGSYNYRPIRGSHAMSMHSYGLAIDFDDQENQQHSQHHLFHDDSLIVKAFEAESAVWGGRWGGSTVDAMHFQFCKVR